MFRFISVLTAIACGVIYISLRVKLAFLFVLVTFLSNFGVWQRIVLSKFRQLVP